MKQKCGFGNHLLAEKNRTINDPKLLDFAKHVNRDIRATTRICEKCYVSIKSVYLYKLKRAKERLKGTKESLSVSSLSNISLSSGVSSLNNNEISSESSLTELSQEPTTSAAAKVRSLAAKRKRKPETAREPVQQHTVSTSSEQIDDDEDIGPSPNATNGTRMPHIQPAPKRRQFVTLQKEVMDIYMAGTTGG